MACISKVSLLSLIGNTPLLSLPRFSRDIEIAAKAEWFNPGGSVKDRPALSMILEGERSGRLKPGSVILDATSGNTGIAYAWIAAAKGYRVKLCLPENAGLERKRILEALGAELIFTPASEGIDGAIRRVRQMVEDDPGKYFHPDQYGNPANWQAHYQTTANEIWEQTEGKITHFVAGLGTSGTFIGTARRLKELNPAIRCISFQPDAPFHGLEGLKHMKTALIPKIYDPSVADDNLEIPTEAGYAMVKALARKEGILAGTSSGAALAASLQVAEGLKSGMLVTIFADSAHKSLTDRFWEEE